MVLPQNIIIGKPLVSLKLLGIEDDEITVFDIEKDLAKVLVKYGFLPSKSEIRRNRKDLIRMLDNPDMELIKLGKKMVWVIIGVDTEDELNEIIKQSEID